MLHIMCIYIYTYILDFRRQHVTFGGKPRCSEANGTTGISAANFRFSGKLPDSAANFSIQRQTSGFSGKLPDSAANFRIQRQTSGFSGKLPDSAANFQFSGKLPNQRQTSNSAQNCTTQQQIGPHFSSKDVSSGRVLKAAGEPACQASDNRRASHRRGAIGHRFRKHRNNRR